MKLLNWIFKGFNPQAKCQTRMTLTSIRSPKHLPFYQSPWTEAV